MGWGLDSPGNQPIGPPFGKPKRYRSRSKCINHHRRNAVAIWGRQMEPVCLECLEKVVKGYKKQMRRR